MARVSGILCHQSVQLILASSWARPAILVAGMGRGRMFLFLLFLHFPFCSSFFPVPLFHLLYYLFYLFSPFLWETTQNEPQGLTCRLAPTNQSKTSLQHCCWDPNQKFRLPVHQCCIQTKMYSHFSILVIFLYNLYIFVWIQHYWGHL